MNQQAYFSHLNRLQQTTENLLADAGFDGLLIGSGGSSLRFQDDYRHTYKANPNFVHWLPFLTQHPGCWLLVQPGKKPVLYFVMADDFWHVTPELPADWWAEAFDVVAIKDSAPVSQDNLAVITEHMPAFARDSWTHNPQALIQELHRVRRVKSEWEHDCLREANILAVQGHLRAEQGFRAGESEYEIHQGYLAAIAHNEKQLPYDNIVGLNEHAAVLHYQWQDRSLPDQHRTLLIDAGANYLGYAADITRTYAAEAGVFADLLAAMEQAQLETLSEMRAGVSYVDLHLGMHRKIAGILQQAGIVRASADTQLEEGVTRVFFPHGLGHLLGIQVHDVGAWQHDQLGTEPAPPAEHPFLRYAGDLEAGSVLTVEPGLYFIPSLLQTLRQSPVAELIDWALVEHLLPFGGIRIEDNVLITAQGIENFTRDAFVAAQ
ncbi:Xaa-Pro dipeptidase [Aliamphritea hakodatensis]|uniref:Xaa-Pro dipeptidase n=1 Tax=Aliamphritea hakodatensis TaxID=2895352 RepID=UPI0022FD71E3|nr:Xaa-Pro dipeptidase [Aliamphritea hakodatensis]